ncbi:MAG: outer membrane protein assembly factor BamD [Steroidobacteraceae bacterium]
MANRLPLLPLLLAAVMVLPGCSLFGGDDGVEQAPPEKLYEKANNMLSSGDFRGSVRVYEALEARYPFSEQARQGQLDVMYAYYKSGQKESALDAADEFVRENPTHPRIDYAMYIKGLVQFERTPNILERWFKTDLTERPPQDARASFLAFQQLIERYPHSDYVHDARERMIYLRNRLAAYEVHVADYYLRRRAYVAALNRARYCIENYDGAPAVSQALDVMIAAYDGVGLTDLADQARATYALNYPDGRPVREDRAWWKFW